jgi:hypothetical protein
MEAVCFEPGTDRHISRQPRTLALPAKAEGGPGSSIMGASTISNAVLPRWLDVFFLFDDLNRGEAQHVAASVGIAVEEGGFLLSARGMSAGSESRMLFVFSAFRPGLRLRRNPQPNGMRQRIQHLEQLVAAPRVLRPRDRGLRSRALTGASCWPFGTLLLSRTRKSMGVGRTMSTTVKLTIAGAIVPIPSTFGDREPPSLEEICGPPPKISMPAATQHQIDTVELIPLPPK